MLQRDHNNIRKLIISAYFTLDNVICGYYSRSVYLLGKLSYNNDIMGLIEIFTVRDDEVAMHRTCKGIICVYLVMCHGIQLLNAKLQF